MSQVMVVDDSMFMRKFIKTMLVKMGHTISCEASEGREAVANYSKFLPDVVTLDITMPGMNGITALKEMLIINPSAKIILCSAMHSQSLVIQAIKTGACDFLDKPIQYERLMQAIQHATQQPCCSCEN
ncbi:response regulator [Paenibacillus psychroresistens]|uniref:Response regulator n=1 Tax=Paenibacillus psychroresistens TaxID=1778678 RepID=A0A6B8RWD0_9BACL|nr:response regulator [Paenibacillus psychroresistens]QGQ99506.1 response regulator [Paenibacillus psychroresistens]